MKRKTTKVPDNLDNQEISIRLEHKKDNPDGSADFEVKMNEYTHGKLVEMAIIGLLKEHIAQQPKQPWYKRFFK